MRRMDRSAGKSQRGFSVMELQVAILLLAIVSLATWATISSTLALMGRGASGSPLKTARLWTVASGWVESELEYAKQLGFGGACASPPCTFWIRTVCAGCGVEVSVNGCGAWATGVVPFSEGPPLPPDFQYGRVVVTTDPNTPTDPITSASYLQLIEVDIYRGQPDCNAPSSYLLAYTSAGIR